MCCKIRFQIVELLILNNGGCYAVCNGTVGRNIFTFYYVLFTWV